MTKHFWKIAGVSLAVIAFASACDNKAPAPTPAPVETPPPAPPAPPPAPTAADYTPFLTTAGRPADDAKRDADRKPAEVLAFTMVKPGQTVIDLEAGGGYYTELLSAAVGPTGKVTMQSPAFGGGGQKGIDARTKDKHLANVTGSVSNFDKLDAADGSVDLVTWFQGPHELWCTKDCGGPLGDPAKSFAEISRVLKPGGLLVIMDHAAKAGEPPTSGDKTHRLDVAKAKELAQGAGFTLDGESNVLANPADDHTKAVFEMHDKTDQYLLRYKKP